ncbi:calcium/sodium antiporter [Frigidibacter sp. RF13]|uniref:calcium/sodium antiporter n=1 Tax=Frigidibacter sp. RF13 TaxID=2997340 RepID=UPI0022712863|nr:calcium/sodium antiporter [Frigidibacter sp. RF13]MCY1125247.1 calcium/sodium antiporter [Frigidibacter sp. RF13]
MLFVWFFLGLVLLFVGGEFLVRGAVGLAHRFRIPPMVIGLTIVGFGTSTPELLVSLQAALGGVPDVAIGNVIGSNIANILLILGLSAVIAPVAAAFAPIRRDLAVMVGSTVLLWLIMLGGVISHLEGGLMLAALAAYLLISLSSGAHPPEEPAHEVASPWLATFAVIGGLAALMLGARFLVDSASEMARAVGVSEAVIGLTIVAIGTSLPELATSLIAALRGNSAIALGNVLGSNIFNILGILGLTAAIHPVPVDARFPAFDLPIALAAALAMVALSYLHDRVGRGAGAAFLAAYLGYTLWIGL